MKHTVVLTAAFPPLAREILAGQFDVVEHPTEQARSEDEMITILSEADGAVTLLSDPLTRRVLAANPNLRIVANFAVGYNNIDLDAARELGVVVTNTPGVLTEATADLTLALILAVSRRIVEGDAEVRGSGRCEWDPLKLLGIALQGKRLGIVGMGRIGAAVARRAAGFGMNVVHHSRSRGIPLPDLLGASDIVSLHTPLTAETRHIIDRAALGRMKRGSLLVNTSRGALVDEEALCDALDAGHLRGAALDVYEDEPRVNPRLLAMPNVVIVPHIGSATEEARNAMASTAATDVRRFLSGQPPLHRVV
ncbi:MAG TPA: D-glycerate dehydrogenase [Thermoanaerobaculia bacterium]|nr:D-glycerate dehydrogenase [Thermoanaerobaculia bacterium]